MYKSETDSGATWRRKCQSTVSYSECSTSIYWDFCGFLRVCVCACGIHNILTGKIRLRVCVCEQTFLTRTRLWCEKKMCTDIRLFGSFLISLSFFAVQFICLYFYYVADFGIKADVYAHCWCEPIDCGHLRQNTMHAFYLMSKHINCEFPTKIQRCSIKYLRVRRERVISSMSERKPTSQLFLWKKNC